MQRVMRIAFGVSSGFLDLRILDSTDPATILHIEESVPLRQTLFIVASKSGTTTEAVAFYHYFFSKIKGTRGNDSGDQFIAITDPGSPLEKIAREQAFRRTFLNFSDIGGRYSALSYFGLVPGALIGVNIRELLERAKCMVLACGPDLPVERNPGLHLGGILGGLAKAGRDKITFILSPALSSFGPWAEQLLSESTGKEGRGLIPVLDEALDAPRVYGDDRVFVHIGFSPDQAEEARLKAVEEAGHPVVRIVLKDALDLGAEFFRWEIATAVAGAILAINPFDEPNVQESKDNTNQLLKEFSARGSLPHDGAFAQGGGVTLYGDQKTSAQAKQSGDGLKGFLAAYLRQAQPGDYVALLVYLEPSTRRDGLLREIRRRLRDGLRLATTLGYGPRYLHSTGQLHKGGPNTGLFIQITADPERDLEIPGENYTFGTLERAQARGDFLSLQTKGRRVIRLHLGTNVEAGLRRILEVVQSIEL